MPSATCASPWGPFQRFWLSLIATAVISSSLSYLVDRVTYGMGMLRSSFIWDVGFSYVLLGVCMFNACLAVLARLVAASTLEAEGSGFPEMKAMLFGKIIKSYLSLRVLVVKLLAMSLGISAGLPLGKDGPNVHIAACVTFLLNRDFFEKYANSSPHGAGATGVGSTCCKLLLAACAMGFGVTFGAPVGGVIFALELMLPQTYDVVAFWGCFVASVVGAFTYALEKRTLGRAELLPPPLVSSNVLPGEGDSACPILELLCFILLGIICGFFGGLFVQCHTLMVKTFQAWRGRAMRRSSLPHLVTTGEELLYPNTSPYHMPSFRGSGGGRMDLLLVAALAVTNTLLAACLPLLGGKPQPLIIFRIFDKDLLEKDTDDWILPNVGALGTLLLCFLAKWTMTIWSLSSDIPGGVVAPTVVLGALLGRIYSLMLPTWCVDLFLSGANKGEGGALMARFAIIGASAFTAAVCRTFAMAITVFEVLTLPNSVLPLCGSALVAIFVANRVSLPFFDATLASNDLGGIPAMGLSSEALWPVMKVMDPIRLETDALPQVLTLRHFMKLVTERDLDFFPIIRPKACSDEAHAGGGVAALLVGCISKRHALLLLKTLDPHGETPRREIDLLNPEFRAPFPLPNSGVRVHFVDSNPVHISPEHTVKDAHLLLKMAETGVIYVTRHGELLGSITLGTLLCREL